MPSRIVAAALVISVLFIAGPGCSGTATRSATPEDAYDNLKNAAQDNDWKTFAGLLTPESQNQMAGSMIMVAATMKMMDSMPEQEGMPPEVLKMKEAAGEAADILNRYGVNEDAFSGVQPMSPPNDPGLAKAGESISDKAGFVGEMMALMFRIAPEGKGPANQNWADSSVSEISIDGDSAAGTVTMDGQDNPITFRKIDGAWFVEIPTGG